MFFEKSKYIFNISLSKKLKELANTLMQNINRSVIISKLNNSILSFPISFSYNNIIHNL